MSQSSQQNQSQPEVIEAELVQKEVLIKDDESWLSEKERLALELFRSNFKKGGVHTYPLSPQKAVDLFQLYLNGSTLSEIADINPELGLGTIVSSAVQDRWDKRHQAYLDELYGRAKDRMFQTTAEGANFLETVLAVAHKQHGEKLRKYLQTDDPDWLRGEAFAITTIRGYKEAVDVLMKITGHDQTKVLKVEGQVNHTETPAQVVAPPEPAPPPLPSVAKSIGELAALKRVIK